MRRRVSKSPTRRDRAGVGRFRRSGVGVHSLAFSGRRRYGVVMIKVGIVGGTGYTGSELLRLLARHPEAEVRVVTSRSEAGVPVASLFPALRGQVDLRFSRPDEQALCGCDVVFFATPNGTAMTQAPALLEADAWVKVIDLSADFRIDNDVIWEHWYGMIHARPDRLRSGVAYGLPEVNREAIKRERLIANPGCYPTAVSLALLPFIEQGAYRREAAIIADCKSGVSGAGRGAKLGGLMAETGESLMAYGVSGHRHLPEIQQTLGRVCGEHLHLMFIPHLVPMIRGILATVYVPTDLALGEAQALLEARYADEPFVDVMPEGSLPETRSVRGANYCRLAVHRPRGGKDYLVVISVIDNLVKGAAGQAVQNMNIRFGLEETLGLGAVALQP